MISTKAHRSSRQGQTTSRNPKFTFLLFVFDIFSDSVSLEQEEHHFSAKLEKRCGLKKFYIFCLKFEAPSRLRVRCLRSRIWASTRGKPDQEGTTDHKERKTQYYQHESSTEPATGPWLLLKSKFCTFCTYFFDIFLIPYYLNRKHTNFHINQTEGVAYRNSTIFSTKFKAPSRL